MRMPLGGREGARPEPRARRAVLLDHARRLRRAGDQARAAGRGRHRARLGRADARRRDRVLREPASQQAGHRGRPQAPARARSCSSAWSSAATSCWRTTASARSSGSGIDYEAARKRNPGIIYCSVSGFGQDGPYRDRAALDLILQAESGMISVTGEPGGARRALRRVDRRHDGRDVRGLRHHARPAREGEDRDGARPSTCRCWKASSRCSAP